MNDERILEMLASIRDELRALRHDLGVEAPRSVGAHKTLEPDDDDDAALSSFLDSVTAPQFGAAEERAAEFADDEKIDGLMEPLTPPGNRPSPAAMGKNSSDASKFDLSNDELEKIFGDT